MTSPRLYATACIATILVAQADAPFAENPTADDTPPTTTSRPTQPDDLAAIQPIRLSPEQITASGLTIAPLKADQSHVELRLTARILDLQPLLELRAGLLATQAEANAAATAARVAQASERRLQTLHRESIVATRELLQAQAFLASEQARELAARSKLAQVRESISHAWGAELFLAISQPNSPLIEHLVNRSHVLGLLSLPPGLSSPKPGSDMKIQKAGETTNWVIARILGPSPRTDEATQGETWYFTAPGSTLRTGMRLDAWQADAETRQSSAVALPLTAVVWYGGLPWVYIQRGTNEFTRRAVGEHRDQAGSWWVESGFRAGENVVVTGAQMLLSHELKGRIPDEDDD